MCTIENNINQYKKRKFTYIYSFFVNVFLRLLYVFFKDENLKHRQNKKKQKIATRDHYTNQLKKQNKKKIEIFDILFFFNLFVLN